MNVRHIHDRLGPHRKLVWTDQPCNPGQEYIMGGVDAHICTGNYCEGPHGHANKGV